jgi:hypothetical protein
VRWAAAEGVSETVAVLLLHERSVKEVAVSSFILDSYHLSGAGLSHPAELG